MRLIAVLAFAFAALAAPAAADQGRALLPTGFPALADPFAPIEPAAVALPDGGAVLFASGSFRRGIVGVRLTPQGTRDPAYSAQIADPNALLAPSGAMLRPDGRIVLTALRVDAITLRVTTAIAAQLMPDGTLDPSFGSGGVAELGLPSDSRPALAPDGTLLMTGTDRDDRWVVASVSPAGQVTHRVVPGSRPGDNGYAGVAVAPDGRVTAAGYREQRSLVARLLPDGTADPAWGRGAPVDAGVDPIRDLALGSDGAVTLLGASRLVRLLPDGARDTAYGTVRLREDLDARLLAEPGGGVLVTRTRYSLADTQPALLVDRVTASGARTTVAPQIRLGGGTSSLSGSGVRPLRQEGFMYGQLLRRPDGSFLVAGSVVLVRFFGETEGESSSRHAVVALSSELKVDRSFGPAFGRPRVSVRVGRLERSRYVLRLRVRASGSGLLAVRVRDRRGRTVVRGLVPVHRAGRQRVRVGTTTTGRRILRHRTAVRLKGRFRDLAAQEVAVRAARGRIGG